MKEDERRLHANRQRSYFDERSDWFIAPVPDEIQERTARIIAMAELDAGSRVLDVATGAGVLIAHFMRSGVAASNITGCDLSPAMLSNAQKRFPDVSFWLGDFLDLESPEIRFDAIFMNACFGNFYDQKAVLAHAKAMLNAGGRIVISHPMGKGFVTSLKAQAPDIVLYDLPDRSTLTAWANELDLSLGTYVDEPNVYAAILRAYAEE